MPSQEVINTFGHQVRLRVCGICTDGNAVLLANHRGVGPMENFWIPPGGGLHFGEPATEALHREFREETGLDITVGEFLFINEFIGPPLHAVEIFFRVYIKSGQLSKGTDPEMTQQIIDDVAFMAFPSIKSLPAAAVHNLFRYCHTMQDLLQMRGYYQFKPELRH